MKIMPLLMLLALLVTQAEARVKLLMFAPGTTSLEAMTAIGFNANTYFRAQPKCDGDRYYPCRRKPMDGQFLGHGAPDGAGGCLLPTLYVFAGHKEFSVSITINEDCNMRFHNYGPVLSFPPDFDPKPEVVLDFGDAAAGIDFQTKVGLGQQMDRLTWTRACVYKCNSDGCYCITRSIACFYYNEKWVPGTPAPKLTATQWCNQGTVKPNKGWFVYGNNLPYINQQVAPWDLAALDQCAFHKAGQGIHWSNAYTAVQEHLIRTQNCQFGGQVPTGTALKCDARFTTTIGQRPL